MSNPAERWNIQPEHYWLRGRQPKEIVSYDEATNVWNVYGYAEVQHVLGTPAVFASDVKRLFPMEANMLTDGDLTMMDGTPHRNLRRLVSNAFTPKTVADLEPRITEIAGELLDAIDGDRFEMVSAFALPMPITVIAELLGVPAADRDMFAAMVRNLLQVGAQVAAELGLEESDRVGVADAQRESAQAFADYLLAQCEERRKRPRQDLVTRLVEAEVDGVRLTDAEVVSFAGLLLTAGFITTTMLLGNTLLCLDSHPEQVARLRADRAAVPAVIEESLRYLSPIAMGLRCTEAETELAGTTIPKDQLVQVWMSAANRDPRQFDRPHEFDPERTTTSHLSFGRGAHFCLGAGLARLEGRVALNLVLDRFPSLRVDPDTPPTFMPLPAFTGVESLLLRTD